MWENNIFTKEFVIYLQEEVNNNLQIIYDTNGKITFINEKKELIPLEQKINSNLLDVSFNFNFENKKIIMESLKIKKERIGVHLLGHVLL